MGRLRPVRFQQLDLQSGHLDSKHYFRWLQSTLLIAEAIN
ncbi:hypothetical protein CP97_14821 [Aurantiacibacter atlanticus]|uniref:Uncharacterized protein n=1 Tax=Aurantiacibacter atlanticus TaxID=1648404 RepID=A0A168M321_9SPHN|nr:hypothetical protein CP97_14821 [Aurantiacibacter atlanticus]